MFYSETESVFKKKASFEKRKKESCRLLEKYKNRLPVIIEGPDKDLHKLLAPDRIKTVQLSNIIKKKAHLNQYQALYFIVGNSVISATETMSSLYKTHKDKDGFLYIFYKYENTFGYNN